jgi:hypothetical protein
MTTEGFKNISTRPGKDVTDVDALQARLDYRLWLLATPGRYDGKPVSARIQAGHARADLARIRELTA